MVTVKNGDTLLVPVTVDNICQLGSMTRVVTEDGTSEFYLSEKEVDRATDITRKYRNIQRCIEVE